MNVLDRPVESLNGVGKARQAQLKKLGISSVRDLIKYYPRAYENRGDVKLLSEASFEESNSFLLVVATSVRTANIRKGLSISKFRAFDESGTVEVVFFNSPFVKDVFTVGAQFRFYGKISLTKNLLQLNSPKYEPYIEGKPLLDFVPVYPLTEGISSKFLEKLISSVIDEAATSVVDFLPEKLRLENSLSALSYAIRNVHFPTDEDALSRSIRRLAFDEMFIFGMAIALNSQYQKRSDGIKFAPCDIKPFLNLLPYELTDSQKKAVNDIYKDTVLTSMEAPKAMSRIIVGDVGSGKTVLSAIAMYICAKSGYQATLMAPTEILARQHYQELSGIYSKLGISCELLCGNTSAKEKTRIYQDASQGKIDVIVGTHALISDNLCFHNLGLVVTDEQHRFGVAQRAKLKDKSRSAHLLVMSATPIPRTLALTMYGDLDVSRLTEMPKGRQRVDTFVVDEGYRARINEFIKKQVMLGGQCYIVCPSIERSEDGAECYDALTITQSARRKPLNLKNAVEYAETLKAVLPECNIACLHGKMKAKEKDSIMSSFAKGEIDVIVSTTVIEVGVNVPNATLMIVENAERFGLSSLHQLRGRVGRGQKKSYCILVSDKNFGNAYERLEVMRTVYDGFEIAERDLLIRGPGDFFSRNSDNNLRQSGGFRFDFASMCDDSQLMELAFSSAKKVIAGDRYLENKDNYLLKKRLEEVIYVNQSNIS